MLGPTTEPAADARHCIAYLGPEIPALSATFVYEELLGLERRGVPIQVFSVRAPIRVASSQSALSRRTRVLYDRPPLILLGAGLLGVFVNGHRSIKALKWLAHDMVAVGLHRLMAWKLVFQCLVGACFAQHLKREGCTHLHVHFAHTPTQIAMYASAFSGIPFTATAHANDIFERGVLLPEKAHRAVKLITISRFNLGFLESIGVPADKLGLVRCGVSIAPRIDVPSFEAKARYRIGTLCRLVEKKGVDDLIRAFALLRDENWDIELRVAGDGPLLAGLAALTRELGVEGKVVFEGALEHFAVTAWLRSLDAFAMACKKDSHGDMDGIPVVLMEAMSQRVPVVATRLSGIPELVIHDETGLLVEPGEPASLAAALRRLLVDAALRARLSHGGARHVVSEFGQDANLDRLLRCFASAGVCTNLT